MCQIPGAFSFGKVVPWARTRLVPSWKKSWLRAYIALQWTERAEKGLIQQKRCDTYNRYHTQGALSRSRKVSFRAFQSRTVPPTEPWDADEIRKQNIPCHDRYLFRGTHIRVYFDGRKINKMLCIFIKNTIILCFVLFSTLFLCFFYVSHYLCVIAFVLTQVIWASVIC